MSKRRLPLLLLLAALVLPAVAAAEYETPQICYDGYELLNKDRVADMPDAIAMLDQCLALDLNDWDRFSAYVNRANARDINGDPSGAIEDYSRAIELNPDHHLIYYNRALALRNLKDYQEAVADHTKAIELKPNFYQAYFNRGLDLTALGQYDRAIADYTKVIELIPDDARAYARRAFVYRDLGYMERARADAIKARELNPKAKVPTSFAPPDKS